MAYYNYRVKVVEADSTLTSTPDAGVTLLSLNLNNPNTWTALQTFGNNISFGGAQLNVVGLAPNDILQYNGVNWVNVAASSLGSVSSVSNVDGTLTIAPNTGAVVASLNRSNANTWLALQTFGNLISFGGAQLNVAGLADNDILQYDLGTNRWVNSPLGSLGYVPYTGATANVNLGAFDLTATNIFTDTVVAPTGTLTLAGGGISNENLLFDFQTTANEVGVSSGTGVTVIDFGTINVEADQFESDIATGIAPFIVASTTLVTNLNADLLDGLNESAFLLTDGTRALTGNWDAGSFEIRAETFESDVLTGTPPFTVASTTLVTNLNADLLDGKDTGTSGNTIPLLDGINTWSALNTFTANLEISGEDPTLTFTETTAGQDDYIITNVDGIFRIRNSTDARTAMSIDSTGGVAIGDNASGVLVDIQLPSGGDFDIVISGNEEASFSANQLLLNNGATDTSINWSTDGISKLVAGAVNTLNWAVASLVVNEDQADLDFRIEGDSISHLFFTDATATTENIAVFAAAAPNWQTMDRGFFVGDASVVPTGNPASGGFLYSEAGALKWRGSSGTITTLGAA